MRKSIVWAVAAGALAVPGAAYAAGASAPDHVAGASRGLSNCTAQQLKASYIDPEGAAGSTYGKIRLKNVSDTTCVTGGYGGLSYVGDGNGTQIGSAAERDTTVTPTSIRLHPGQSVVSQVREADALNYDKGTCHPHHVDGFRLYVPNETHAKFVKHPTTGCLNAHVHLLSTQAYVRA